MSDKNFDLIVLGGGPAGYVAAIRGAQLGMKVACVDKEKRLGGTCLRVGCIPSKALLESSHLFSEANQKFSEHGIGLKEINLDLKAMMSRKEKIVTGLTGGIDTLFRKNKVEKFTGTAKILEPGKVEVEGSSDTHLLNAPSIIIATGSKVHSLPGIELDGKQVVSSTEALEFEKVPKKLIVIGAGAIGLELGSVWNRLGSEVVVMEYLDRILPGMDLEIAKEAQKLLEKQGLKFHLNAKVTGANQKKSKCSVEWEGGDPIEAEKVLVAIGRIPNTDGLGIEDAGVQLDKRGRIKVNNGFQTSVKGIYAVGDVIAGPMLAHKAEEEGIACVEKIAGKAGHVNYQAIPGVVYTYPEVASVGETEEQLKENKVPYNKGMFPFIANGRARCIGHPEGRVKILANQKTDRILGVHIVGAHAGDLIAEAAVAIEFGASSEDVARSSHAHPSLAEIIKEAALDVESRAIHKG